jgi:hypothetical protein
MAGAKSCKFFPNDWPAPPRGVHLDVVLKFKVRWRSDEK